MQCMECGVWNAVYEMRCMKSSMHIMQRNTALRVSCAYKLNVEDNGLYSFQCISRAELHYHGKLLNEKRPSSRRGFQWSLCLRISLSITTSWKCHSIYEGSAYKRAKPYSRWPAPVMAIRGQLVSQSSAGKGQGFLVNHCNVNSSALVQAQQPCIPLFSRTKVVLSITKGVQTLFLRRQLVTGRLEVPKKDEPVCFVQLSHQVPYNGCHL